MTQIPHVCVRKCFHGAKLWRPGEETVFAGGKNPPQKKNGSPHFIPLSEIGLSNATGKTKTVDEAVGEYAAKDAKDKAKLRRARKSDAKAKSDK